MKRFGLEALLLLVVLLACGVALGTSTKTENGVASFTIDRRLEHHDSSSKKDESSDDLEDGGHLSLSMSFRSEDSNSGKGGKKSSEDSDSGKGGKKSSEDSDSGKGGKKSSEDSDSGKGGKKSNKKSGKGGKGGKSGKKSGKKGKGVDAHTSGKGNSEPSASPVGSSRSADRAERPPSPIPPAQEPSSRPLSSIAPATLSSLQAVELPQYAISYTLAENLMPMREDFFQVEELTQTFFKNYMINVFDELTATSLVDFTTTLQNSEFQSGQPVVIVFDSKAFFSQDTTAIPNPQALENVLQRSLADPDHQDYIDLLVALGEQNAFAMTTDVEFVDPSFVDSNAQSTRTKQSSKSKSPAAIATAAVGLTLLVAGLVLYRRRDSDSDEAYYDQKGFMKPDSGNATVAGETYAGETCDGTASIAPCSFLSGDEEQGLVNVDLDSSSVAQEASSIAPAWDGESVSSPTEANTEESDDEIEQGNEATMRSAGDEPATNIDGPQNTEPIRSDHDDSSSSLHSLSSAHKPNKNETPGCANGESGEIEAPKKLIKTLEDFDAYLDVSDDDGESIISQDGNATEPEQSTSRRPLTIGEIESMIDIM